MKHRRTGPPSLSDLMLFLNAWSHCLKAITISSMANSVIALNVICTLFLAFYECKKAIRVTKESKMKH